MNKDLDELLVKSFPNLYRDRHKPIAETCLAFGFECENGWYNLIHQLSGILEFMIENLPEDIRSEYRAAQVKEKYSGMRFYMTLTTPEMEILIDEFERKSFYICEECGSPGSLRTKGRWYMTRCDECFDATR